MDIWEEEEKMGRKSGKGEEGGKSEKQMEGWRGERVEGEGSRGGRKVG